ncbi:hypothetical protein CALCODRAFT_87179 [Calocera cornea HHB12733]|uniref:Uncharacterized protein n=1 Tax=Calocera cornea HHB12733 TaxID=1353952 RepID=A0A165DD08_9BASI|nr:hypothetical protein CALCODRAFT_87179 [Calocera cornea HHB12733]
MRALHCTPATLLLPSTARSPSSALPSLRPRSLQPRSGHVRSAQVCYLGRRVNKTARGSRPPFSLSFPIVSSSISGLGVQALHTRRGLADLSWVLLGFVPPPSCVELRDASCSSSGARGLLWRPLGNAAFLSQALVVLYSISAVSRRARKRCAWKLAPHPLSLASIYPVGYLASHIPSHELRSDARQEAAEL